MFLEGLYFVRDIFVWVPLKDLTETYGFEHFRIQKHGIEQFSIPSSGTNKAGGKSDD